MPHRHRTIVADDHPAVLAALTRILEPHCDVVSVARDGEDLLRQVDKQLPDVVVTDIFMPGMNGIDACGHIRRNYPSVQVVIVSEHLDEDVSARAFGVGASAVVRKLDMVEELPAAIRALE